MADLMWFIMEFIVRLILVLVGVAAGLAALVITGAVYLVVVAWRGRWIRKEEEG